MAQYVDATIVSANLKVSMIRSQPAVYDIDNLDLTGSDLETARCFLTAIPRVTFDIKTQLITVHREILQTRVSRS